MSPEAPQHPDFVTVRRAARRLGLSPSRLRAAIESGALPAYRPGSRWTLVDMAEVAAWIKSHRVAAPDPDAHVAEILRAVRSRG